MSASNWVGTRPSTPGCRNARAQNTAYAGATVTTPGVGVATSSVFIAGAPGGAFFHSARQDTLGWKARAYVNMDARTQTAWGTVQTVFSVAIRSRSGIWNAGGGFNPGGNNTASPQVYAAYIRFAGFTFGRAPWVMAAGPGFLFYHSNLLRRFGHRQSAARLYGGVRRRLLGHHRDCRRRTSAVATAAVRARSPTTSTTRRSARLCMPT